MKMSSTKKDLEIIYNLQWKNNPGHVNDKANIVAMCDIPATTLNWETFKSYLLKNSGAAGDDVKVSYVSIDDKEFPIESQLDFQIALYSFRQRARNGGIITLKLDCISNSTRNGPKRLRRMDDKSPTVPDLTLFPESESPDWFKKYMNEFKKELIDEVTESVMNAVSALKICNQNRKAKFECSKRQRKNSFGHNLGEVNEKEFIKSLKLERKLDCKLEKLEQKTMKIKEKKMTLLQNTENDKQNDLEFNPQCNDIDGIMGVSVIGKHEVSIHMLGGETYKQEWEVINSGVLPWTSDTELRYAWGSETLKPVAKIVPCPLLKPQEKGTISVYLEIPKKPGMYECYWYFHHENLRLARWVGCQFIVDPSPLLDTPVANALPVEKPSEILLPPLNFNTSTPKKIKLELEEQKLDNYMLMNVNDNLQNLKLDSGCLSFMGYESKPHSIISISGSNSSINSSPSDEFVVLRLPQAEEHADGETSNVCIPVNNIKVEKIDDIEAETPVQSEDGNNSESPAIAATTTTLDKTKEAGQYAYVLYNGEKIAVPKSLLHADFLATAEDAPDPTLITPKKESETAPMGEAPKQDMTNSISENKRLFVFPLNCPGFEVVYPTSNSLNESINLHLNESCGSAQTSIADQRFDPPSLYNLIHGNVSMSSSCVGNGSECLRCNATSYQQNVYPEPTSYSQNFNHSKCGGGYCQFTPNKEQSNSSSQFSNCDSLPRYQSPCANSPVHDIPSAPHPQHNPISTEATGLHILPDTLVSGAVNVASSAINTARSVLNMFTARPEQGKWHNGHWIGSDLNSPRERALRTLHEMGFWDRDLNATLLARYNDDIVRVISELVQ